MPPPWTRRRGVAGAARACRPDEESRRTGCATAVGARLAVGCVAIHPPPFAAGHYHKPHTVAGTRITYIGSPYQGGAAWLPLPGWPCLAGRVPCGAACLPFARPCLSWAVRHVPPKLLHPLPPLRPSSPLPAVTRAEAGQRKRLLLLDRSAGWDAVDQLPLDIGPRYFAAAAARPPAPPPAPEAAAAAAGDGAAAVDCEAAAGEAAAGEAAVDAAAAEAVAEAAAEAAPEYALELPEGLRPGDRLLLTLPAEAAKQHAKRLKKLEKQGGRGGGWGVVGLWGCRTPAALRCWCLRPSLRRAVHGPDAPLVAAAFYTPAAPSLCRLTHSHTLPFPWPPRSSPTGIEIEVFTPPEAAAAPRISAAEGMGPLQVGEGAGPAGLGGKCGFSGQGFPQLGAPGEPPRAA